MDDRFKRALYSARPRLRKALKLTEILPCFHRYADGYLEDEEEKEVESLGTDVEKVDRLIRITIQKGDDAFDQFCNILKENNYATWADELRRIANSGEYSEYLWYHIGVIRNTLPLILSNYFNSYLIQ